MLFQVSNTQGTPRTGCTIQLNTLNSESGHVLLSSYTSSSITIASTVRHTLVRKQRGDGNDLRNTCHQSFIQNALIGYLRCTCGIFTAPHLNEEKVIGLRKLRFLY